MSDYEIECTECMWSGNSHDLLCHPDDDDLPVNEARFNVCPDCENIDCFEDIEEDV